MPQPRPSVMAIDAYVPGKSSAPASGPVYKLSSNETPLGPSPKAGEAFRAASQHLELYPEGTSCILREALARHHGLDPRRIVCGAGSDELLSLLAYGFLGAGDEGVYTTHGFLVYKIAILAAGAVPVVVAERALTADVDAILACVTPRTRMVFLANPNNPTGTWLPTSEIARLHRSLPENVLLVLDGAYAEYVTASDYACGLDLAASAPNVVVTRTFSKIYGLAALRLGWMYGSAPVVDAINRIRGPFNVSTAAMQAGVAAVEDQEHIRQAVAHNTRWLNWLTQEISALGLEVTPSVANFLLIHFPVDPLRCAAAADAFLSQRGLILRGVGSYGLPHCLRLTVGSEEGNRLVVAALRDFMAGQGA